MVGNTLESVAIRRGESADADALQAVVVEASTADAPLSGQNWQALLNSPSHFIYAAEDTVIFGFVAAGNPLLTLPGFEEAGEIIGLWVKPAYQRHGMGTKLLVRGLSVLKRRAFATAFAWLPDASPDTERVFRSVGFESTGVTRVTNQPAGEIAESGFLLALDKFF